MNLFPGSEMLDLNDESSLALFGAYNTSLSVRSVLSIGVAAAMGEIEEQDPGLKKLAEGTGEEAQRIHKALLQAAGDLCSPAEVNQAIELASIYAYNMAETLHSLITVNEIRYQKALDLMDEMDTHDLTVFVQKLDCDTQDRLLQILQK